MKRTATALTLALGLLPLAAQATDVTYSTGDMEFEGYMASPEGESKGTVLLIHDWDGLTEYEQTRADMLAEMGYTVFAADLYGKGNRPESVEARKAEVGKLYNDRETMRARILASLAAARDGGAGAETVVMGYCFGGAAVLELARSGEAEGIAGYASFHGGLKTPDGQDFSRTDAPVMVLHGGADAGIPMTDVADIASRMEDAGVSYEIEVYSGAPHAWTVFGSPRYREAADQKSWAAFGDFLGETLN